jgi:FtsP/CotA-like multicopper oxidase with cupredoxin domain
MQLPKINRLSDRLGGRVSRRRLIQGSAGGVATSALIAADGALGSDSMFAQATPEPQHHEFTLTASEFDWDLMDDVTVKVWGYNEQIPGPEFRVREGDSVKITLRNLLTVPTTIHWHGINVPNAMDGVAGLNQEPVKPGEEFVYEFTATPGGSRWYHSHTDPHVQVPMGLYGALIVEPLNTTDTWDREYTLFLAEWDNELTPGVAAGTDPLGPGDQMLRGGELGADLFLLNGRMHGAVPPLMVKEGERCLIRLIHAGAIPHPIHTHGHSFKIVATDGNTVPEVARLTKDTVLIGPSERYDLEFTADNPGVWMVHCHIEHHMANGMMTTIWYEGFAPTGPVADAAVAEATMAAERGNKPHQHEMGTPVPEETPPVLNAEQGNVVNMVDDRYAPDALTIKAGETVTWVNKGAHWHTVASLDLRFTSGKIFPGKSFSYTFEKPGVYKVYCQHHAMAGMNGVITVT